MIAYSVGLGLVLSFLFTELTGLTAGGLIVPGYLALYLDQPQRLAATFAVALATYAVVRLMGNHMIIYGRRRFMCMILVGFWFGWLLTRLTRGFTLAGQDLVAIGYVIPGLIANDAAQQGIWRTALAVLFVSAIVRLILLLVQ